MGSGRRAADRLYRYVRCVMGDESPELSPEDDNSNLGLIVVVVFALGIPLLGMILGLFTHTPKP